MLKPGPKVQMTIGGEAAKIVAEGTGKVIGMLVYDFNADNILVILPNDFDKDEAKALLQKFTLNVREV